MVNLIDVRLRSIIVSVATIISITACQSTPTAPVMQRANATFETTGMGVSKVAAQRQALDSANKTCRSKQPIILTDVTKYNGIGDEQTGRLLEQVGSVVGTVLGGKTQDISSEDDYEYTITFKCQ